MTAAVAGLLFGLSLIAAIGAQNAFVLRQGLRRELVGPVVAVCSTSDAILIAAGVAGLGVLVDHAPDLLATTKILGAAFLLGYAAPALRRVASPRSLHAEREDARPAYGRVLVSAVLLTWLNPHVYLDTVLLLGSVAASHGSDRWWFALGATTGSVLWFSGLGYGARLLGPLFVRPGAWRALDALVAATMTAVAVGLLV
ncbi:amino acid transporter [Nocardioides pocheonensis]|uniref:Amino acid transporter n=1 Tax=Nocardioides pocheonensis TaxID=661485 RepID=A0A3N0GZL1_9ACTN|nr:amino acid transporter [Nocardioides pocheonensis]